MIATGRGCGAGGSRASDSSRPWSSWSFAWGRILRAALGPSIVSGRHFLPNASSPTPALFDRAGALFRTLHGSESGRRDRLGPMNDLLIALTAWRIGAAVVTSNSGEFTRIAGHLPGLVVVEPSEPS